MRLALSTDLYYPAPDTREERLKRLLDLPVDHFELGSRTSPDEIETLARDLRQAHRTIVALHNYCPVPRMLLRSGQVSSTADGDAIPFTSLDPNDRRHAIEETRNTLQWAARVEADFVVVECGAVHLSPPTEILAKLAGPTAKGIADTLREQFHKRRAELTERHLDAVRLCLDPILEFAADLGITVALENRAFPQQLPNTSDMERLLEEFRGAPLGTWFNVGNAYQQQGWGWQLARDVEQTLKPTLLGYTLHDGVSGEGGMIPGLGEYPLTSALPAADDEAAALRPVVVRIHCEDDDKRVAAALEALRLRRRPQSSDADAGDDDDDDPTLFDGYVPIIGGR